MPISFLKKSIFFLMTSIGVSSMAQGQFFLDRLPSEKLNITAPSKRVEGIPGELNVIDSSCQIYSSSGVRRRIVNIAIQEWGFFGFNVLDQTHQTELSRRNLQRSQLSRLGPSEALRLADTIAGYWSITPDAGWILRRQNGIWNGPNGTAARWRDPWSAAFISWVMCEGGVNEMDQFHRAIAHHVYIDQAIEARLTDTNSAYIAHDVGELPIEPGDLLCSARRAAYRSIADRAQNIGDGIRSHCDIAIKVDETNERVLVIGGNVRGAVRLKLLAATFDDKEESHALVRSVGLGTRTIFAHLKLRAEPITGDALEGSPTIKALMNSEERFAWLRGRLAF